jgi:sugar transferase (PEP-CTERM/EpsH1 system associated)
LDDILFLAHRIPYPPDKGDKIRSWHMLRHLAARARVHLGAFVDDPADMAHADMLRSLCASVKLLPIGGPARALRAGRGLLAGAPLSVALFADAAMRRWVDTTVASNPVRGLFAFSGQMAPYVLRHVRGRRTVMDFVDLDSEKWAQYARESRGPRAWVYAREARRLLAFEAAVAARVDATLFVSEDEAALFRARVGVAGARVHALSNGVDLAYFDPQAEFARSPVEGHDLRGPIFVFTGAMDYRPNMDAVRWFADAVWPTLTSRMPDARFLIVGSKPGPEVRALGERANIIVTGRVADVRPYVAAATMIVAPLRIARGIQNKVLEAMAMARPVVATPQAREGIDAVPGRDLAVAQDAHDFAAACRALAADPTAAAALGNAARARVVACYAWEPKLRLLDDLLLESSGTRAAREAA